MIEMYERKLGAMTHQFLKKAGSLLQKARDLETVYFQVRVVRTMGECSRCNPLIVNRNLKNLLHVRNAENCLLPDNLP